MNKKLNEKQYGEIIDLMRELKIKEIQGTLNVYLELGLTFEDLKEVLKEDYGV